MSVKYILFVLCFLDASTVKLSVIKSVAVDSETCAALSIALTKNANLPWMIGQVAFHFTINYEGIISTYQLDSIKSTCLPVQ